LTQEIQELSQKVTMMRYIYTHTQISPTKRYNSNFGIFVDRGAEESYSSGKPRFI